MRLDQIAVAAAGQVFGRLARRMLVAAALAIFALVALYQGSVAGTLALEDQYGAINAHVILCVIYAFVALIFLTLFWVMGRSPSKSATPALAAPREMQIAMLVEAVMLGYTLARKGERAR